MGWISNSITRQRRTLHIGAVILLSGILIIGGTPINRWVGQVVFTGFYYPFFKIRNSVEELYQVSQENHRLRQSLVEASVAISMHEEARRENDRFRSVLGYDPPPGYTLLPAKVMSVYGNRQPILATINRGAHDSVLVDQPVINQEGLIGRVVAVTADYATVQLLTHPANRVAARVGESREMGIVKYSADEGMTLDNLPVQSRIAVGDLILSSGLGGIYPTGLKVGTVLDVARLEDEPFCRVQIRPLANFNSIEELFILKVME